LAVFCFTFNYEIQETGLLAARKALSLNPGSPALIDLLGTGLMLTGDYDSAERFLLEAAKLDPNQSAILIHLGQLKALLTDYESAREYLRAAMEFAPSNRLRELASQLLREISDK
jgi:Flp pilus assembly protein TadD